MGVGGRLYARRVCGHLPHMSHTLQIRNVPDELHRKLKARATAEGKSLSEYLLAELRLIVELPTAGGMAHAARNAGTGFSHDRTRRNPARGA